jgi:beta-alanine--pyruvate transaminase
VDTALKIAIAWHRVRGEGARTRLIGRERGYHGVGFGGISVGGMVNNRKFFGAMLPGVDHLRHTHDPSRNLFSKGLPAHGAEFADDLERLVALHDASTIAAVIVEPIAGSTGVLLPPKGYLERLREICTKHGILLIFDEVITGFGRTGSAFAAQEFDVVPDLMTCAKGLTNGAVPMGAVFASRGIYDTFMQGPPGAIELFHGYTYSAHPIACAAGLAALKIYRGEGLFERAKAMAPYWSDAVHALKGRRNVVDLRAYGLVAGIEIAPREGAPGARGYDALVAAFNAGLLIRITGDTIAMSPPLTIERKDVDRIFETLAGIIDRLD